jgi:hypothetical protein
MAVSAAEDENDHNDDEDEAEAAATDPDDVSQHWEKKLTHENLLSEISDGSIYESNACCSVEPSRLLVIAMR